MGNGRGDGRGELQEQTGNRPRGDLRWPSRECRLGEDSGGRMLWEGPGMAPGEGGGWGAIIVIRR